MFNDNQIKQGREKYMLIQRIIQKEMQFQCASAMTVSICSEILQKHFSLYENISEDQENMKIYFKIRMYIYSLCAGCDIQKSHCIL